MTRYSFRALLAMVGVCLLSSTGLAQHAAHQSQPKGSDSDRVIPYLADTCPISGEKLGEMGDPVVREYDGREVRFCCKKCIPKFEADKKAGFEKLDKLLIKAQLPYYPLSTCIISGESLTDNGEDIGINMIYQGRLVRFCCKDCVGDFNKDPEGALKRIDAAIVEQQGKAYPMGTCPVSGEKLGEMGDPHEVVVGTELVKLCCPKCEHKLMANPTKFLATLNEAWKRAGVPEALAAAPEVGGDRAGHHEGAEDEMDRDESKEQSKQHHGG